MLRINQNSHASAAKSYYTQSDYYMDGQELAGVWRGKGAEKLGLAGEIQRADWDAVCDGLNPKTGEKLLVRRKDNRTTGYDFNFHVPKSVSVLYGMTRDERILDAFRDCVGATMRDIESEMQTRVRKGGANENRTTGNMLWGEFVHFTSRPVDGVPDPHLHAHCFVFNATWDQQEKCWKAGQFRELKRDAPYFEALFHSRFSRRLADLGLPVERTRTGWEISGVPRSLVDKFSRRTALIEEAARDKGIEDPAEKAELGAKTRSRKIKDLTLPELQREWRARLTDGEADALTRIAKSLGGPAARADAKAAELAVEYAIGHEFERRSVMPERALLATALKRAVGLASLEQVVREADRRLVTGEYDGVKMATTREVLKEEMAMLDWCRRGRGTMPPMAKPGRRLKREKLNSSQRAAVQHILHDSRDRVTLLRGAAGTGKSKLMAEVADGIAENGGRIVALAPTAEATEVLRKDGFKSAQTLAMFLKDTRLQQRALGAVLWCDEAGLVGSKTIAEFFSLADKLDSRVILTGDKRRILPSSAVPCCTCWKWRPE